MTSVLAVLPSISERMTAECLATLTAPIPVVTVDNTRANLGVSASWNISARTVLASGINWLLILSAGVRFGTAGGRDLLDHLDNNPDAIAIEAQTPIGWHLIAFPRTTLHRVGLFDERFFPGYENDCDYAYRMMCEFRLDPAPDHGDWWPHLETDVDLVQVAHGLAAGVPYDAAGERAKIVAKHGGLPGAEVYRSAFGRCPSCGSVWEWCHANKEAMP